MPSCAGCRGAVGPGNGALRRPTGPEVFHVRCAPDDLLRDALEEWNAISSKGIRYFVEKYCAPELKGPAGDAFRNGELFMDLGRALRTEAETRGRR